MNSKILFTIAFVAIVSLFCSLACGEERFIQPCPDAGSYFSWLGGPNKNHLGHDYNAPADTKVKAIADGTIFKIFEIPAKCYCPETETELSQPFVWIKHRLSNGQYFFALYGHIEPYKNIKEGVEVKARQGIGKINECYVWDKGKLVPAPHLHFGIWNSKSPPPMEKVGYGPARSFDDPIEFLEKNKPYIEQTQVTKEKILIDSSLYRFEYSKPITEGPFTILPVSVRGPADELALILTNPKGETDIKFIDKRALIDNFETVKLVMGVKREGPLSEGPYILTVKTVTSEKVIYKIELWFTAPKDIKITSGEITLKYAIGMGGSQVYTITEHRITLKNEGDLPFFLDKAKIVFTLPGRRIFGRLEEEFEYPYSIPLGPLSVPSGEFKLDGGSFEWFSYDGPSDKISAILKLYKNGKVISTFPLKLIIIKK